MGIYSFGNDKALSPALTLRYAPCHKPDSNGVGGEFPSLMNSQIVKSENLDFLKEAKGSDETVASEDIPLHYAIDLPGLHAYAQKSIAAGLEIEFRKQHRALRFVGG